MRTFNKVDKVYIKSNNNTNKIFNRYLFCLIPYVILILFYNLIWGNFKTIINLLISSSVSIILSVLIAIIFHAIKKQKIDIKNILIDEKNLIISIILGLFNINSNILITIASVIITCIIKNFQKKVTISSALYGILIIILSNYFTDNLDTPLLNLTKLSYINSFDNIVKPYGNILSYTLGLNHYLSPIISLIVFIYLFSKKSIKYNIVASYILAITITMLSFGLINNMNIWYLFFHLTTGNLLFLIVFLGTDYSNTPTTGEGQFLYGLLLGTITSILRFIIPELSVILTLILGQLSLTKFIDNLSFKLRYNKKHYHLLLTISIVILLITNIIINIVIK